MLQIDENKFEEPLSLVKDNNKMLKDIWINLFQGSPNDDFKNFFLNVLANQFGR